MENQMRNKLAQLAITFSAIVCSSMSSAGVIEIGNDLIVRDNADSWSNFVLGLPTEGFAHPGTLDSWSVYTSGAGSLGLLILEDIGSDQYAVRGADQRAASAGLNTFSFTPTSGSAYVQSGWFLGLWIGTSKVYWNNTGGDTAIWCGINGCAGTIPSATDVLALGESGFPSGGSGSRTYSVQATYVPEPGTVALFGLGLAVLGWRYRSRREGAVAA
jgi:hypothetical protein